MRESLRELVLPTADYSKAEEAAERHTSAIGKLELAHCIRSGIDYTVYCNRSKTEWFVRAAYSVDWSSNGLNASSDNRRASKTLQTKNRRVADRWIEAVNDGRVRVRYLHEDEE